MKKILSCFLLLCLGTNLFLLPVSAANVPQATTPDYKVAFYAFDCYNMQDENGQRSGYGYEMMENIAKYMQCTFSYVGYDQSATECVQMLREGKLDIYTAAKLTPEREAEFAISTHPAITATTCMNVKVGNNKIISGDYSTYNGLVIGLLARHTYNDKFLEWANEKGFRYEIKYYETQTELSNALVDGKVDALVNSYIRTPEDEATIESFGETPYYIMARKEDQDLIDKIDDAIDQMNVESPNWRSDLYNKYYGTQASNIDFTDEEQALLTQLQRNKAVIRAVFDPDANPYSFFNDDGEAAGIAVDLFKSTAEALGLSYEFLPVSNRAEYIEAVTSGQADVWLDADPDSEVFAKSGQRYKLTDAYMTSSVSVMRERGASKKIENLVLMEDSVAAKEILSDNWPSAEVVVLDDTQDCVQALVSGKADGVLLMTYTAQKLSRDDVQNRLRVDIVPGASLPLRMGINANDTHHFYGIWNKALAYTAENDRAEIVQNYVEETTTPSLIAYLFDHPATLIIIIAAALLFFFVLLLYTQSVRSKNRHKKISKDLAAALKAAEDANTAKNDFFSKMSHDIRTPLNVVLGMTQIAQKYKDDPKKLSESLENITSEGKYLLMLINSILDVNQLEHGHMELNNAPFDPSACVQDSMSVLRPLADKKEQHLSLTCDPEHWAVVGDANRFSQIIINIASNAIKYTDGGGTIDLRLERLPDGRCRFVCADNGIGMSQDFLAHITEDYVRAEDSRVSKTQGTGLGMSVVKGFTDLMGGTLTVESELGKGSTFTVDIPFAEATEEQREAVLAPKPEEEDRLERFQGKKVLLAEDNALNSEIAIELLQTIGLTVDWAENGALAVERFEASELDEYFAVFMDMQMPVMDGVEATKRIRASAREDHVIPIFAMTANTFAADRKKCWDAGMSGYIAKPIDVEVITSTLEDNT